MRPEWESQRRGMGPRYFNLGNVASGRRPCLADERAVSGIVSPSPNKAGPVLTE
jgi:hypothetical protein